MVVGLWEIEDSYEGRSVGRRIQRRGRGRTFEVGMGEKAGCVGGAAELRRELFWGRI